ncbi:L-aspartate oxidase [Rhodococcus fascians]|nr:L-aspartate oxidase [Rhodococcus fascians]MBY3997090.1 L-aspartate oxidase [Rhodococcus fascians]MBY4002444.1 L-aspartate oxidase [Rhodococcus fascians]MBY4006436.1 L-aspartate oxidase [Rhodococcus fascians]MBY4017894.1 L-aspartate oxidase [Rhodococcus fascians]
MNPSVAWETAADLVVVGGGIAGLTAARTAAARGLRVLTVSKGSSVDTATKYAQGGIAVVGTDLGDSIDAHVSDTCAAGAGLCDEDAVRSIVSGGRAAIASLEVAGAHFDRAPDGSVSCTREGGHSVRRIIHSGGDATGAEVQRALDSAVPSVEFDTTALRVLTTDGTVAGLLVRGPRGVGVVRTPTVLLATGGLGQLFSCSTNPAGATADGIALALDAGARVTDLEFVQFHPTVLFAAGSTGRRPLISEAVRGEGARLVDVTGRAFMDGVHPMADLAPRDVVSRAIAELLHRSGDDHVLLDARRVEHVRERFPTVTASCLDAGIDPATDLIPVAPAAHYSCGGIVTDTFGRTSVSGLLAAGEVARTGLHGANRLASNSLLEGLVVGERAALVAAERVGTTVAVSDTALPVYRRIDRAVLQRTMTTDVGVVRDASGLAAAQDVLAHGVVSEPPVDGVAVEDAALTAAADVIVLAAAHRRESRGCHTRRDFPDSMPEYRRSLYVERDDDGRLTIVNDDVMTGAS